MEGSSSLQAGPSTLAGGSSAGGEVKLAVEPVHVFTDASANHPSGSSGSNSGIIGAFERERKLQDVTTDGRNVFAQRKAAAVQLSEDVRRLWGERGDFSRFRTADLKRSREAGSANDSQDDDDDEDAAKSKTQANEVDEGLLRKADAVVGGTIGETEFVELRNKVLGSLDVAHFNSIHAHQLLGMLIKQYRSTSTSNNSTTTAAGRMGSPAPSVGGQSNRSGSAPSGAATLQKAPLGIFGHLNAPANREEEFILDPLAISLSRTSLNASTAVRRDISADNNEEGREGEEEEDDEYADPSSAGYGLKQAKRELEATASFKENKLREFKVVLETKRKAISNAAELLGSAAEELRRGHAGNRERWRSLIGLRGRGWGVTPGRPLVDVERFGVTTNDDEEEGGEAGPSETKEKKETKKKEKKPAGLQGFGTPILTSDGKIKEEGARDAWIGFGLPEAPVELRRRSIAYWADTASLPSDAEVKAKLVFPDRLHRRLRVRFVLWPATASSSNGSSEGKVDNGRIEWSSDADSSAEKEEGKKGEVPVGQIIDTELQDASREASDELIFGDVVAQARLLPPSFGVRLTSSSVRIVLTRRLDLVVELVSTTSSASKKDEKEGKGESALRYAPHAALVLAFLRMGPLRKYQAFVRATEQGRRSDAAARAAAIKAIAIAVPKKSNAQTSNNNAASSNSGGKGIAAGGKASSVALAKLDTLGPVVVGLHYWSFVHRLGSVLEGVQRSAEERGVSKVKVQLVPVTPGEGAEVKGVQKLEQLTNVFGRMVDAIPSTPLLATKGSAARTGGDGGSRLHTIFSHSASTSSSDVLKGYAKVWSDNELVCTLSFAQPSLLSVQFADSRPTRRNGGVGKKGKGGVKLTSKPLAVDLDTLSSLLTQQLAQYS